MLDGKTALVGAIGADVDGNNNQGKVYFFEQLIYVNKIFSDRFEMALVEPQAR